MISLARIDQCTGCMACKQICPKQCIGEREDALGNIYPEIDLNKCVDCGSCMLVCPEIHADELAFQAIKQANAVWSLNVESRASSTSGGAASEFYANALKQGYWICGVEYMENFHAIHTLSKKESDIRCYKQSKYVYSESGTVYREIKERLKNNEKILFISLPCKVSALKQYLGKEYTSLITVDIVCHGTPAYRQLNEHIIQNSKKAASIRFRFENEFAFQVRTDNDELIYNKTGHQDEYLAAFLEGLNYRPSCYQCTYARPDRISDITICDFWGLGKEIPWEHFYTGAVSAVLINTEHGMEFFDGCRKSLFVEKRPIDEAVKGNAQLNTPTRMHPKRREFETIYQREGFDNAVNKVLKDIIRKDKKLQQKRNLKKMLRRMAGVLISRYRS